MRLRLPTLGTQAVFFGLPLLLVSLLSFYNPLAKLSISLAIICIALFSLINASCAIFADNLKTYFLISSFCFLCYLCLSGLFLYPALAEQSFGFWAILLLIMQYSSLWLMASLLRQFLIRR
jgi:hypothetical protein